MGNDEKMDWVDYTALGSLALLTLAALIYLAYNFGQLCQILLTTTL